MTWMVGRCTPTAVHISITRLAVRCAIPRLLIALSLKVQPSVARQAFVDMRTTLKKSEEIGAGKPVYITETNTQGFDAEGQTNGGKPSASYVTGWIQTTYEEIRRLNTEKNAVRNDWPRILCLCWFVDDNQDGNWGDFALSNDTSDKLSQARTDFKASDTSTGISPADPTSNLAPSSPIIEHRTGISILSNTVS